MVGSSLDGLSFQFERTKDVREEAWPLIQKHYKEVGIESLALNPDWGKYEALEEIGMYAAYTARENGKLIGYNGFFLNTAIHNYGLRQAIQDVVFIEKEKRGFGREFIEWCDNQLRAIGTKIIFQHIKAKNNYGPMLEGMGYKLLDLVYFKEFQGG